MFKMGCSMARRILGPGQSGTSGNQEQAATCFSVAPSPSSSHQDNTKKTFSSKGHAKLAGGDASTTPGGGASNSPNKPNQPSSELNDFSKLEDDPRLPLNVRQIFKITKSWKAIARTMSKTGTAMFLNLFEQNQDLFYLFDRFQNLKGKDLHESMELREHAATVMATLDTSINSLSDYDNFVTYLHSIGRLHRKVAGFKREYFWKIEQPFMKAVKQTLDERCNETIEEIYKIAIKLIIETIAEGYGQDEPNTNVGQPNDSSRAAQGGGPTSGAAPDQVDNNNLNGQSSGDNCDANKNNKSQSGTGNGGGGGGGGCRRRQNQQTSKCNRAPSERVGNDCWRHKTRAMFHYSATRRIALTKIVILTRFAKLRWWRQQSRQTTKFNLNQLDAHTDRGQPEAELISATCKLMNTTKNLIDSCESHAHDDNVNSCQPQAQMAKKLLSWRGLIVNLNYSLINEVNGGRCVERDGLEVNASVKDQRERAVFGDNLKQQSSSSERENRKRDENRKMSAGEITLCPMRQRDDTTTPTSDQSVEESVARVCCAVSDDSTEGSSLVCPDRTRTIERNMNHMTGGGCGGASAVAVRKEDQCDVYDDGLGLTKEVQQGTSMQIGKQTERLEHEKTTRRDDDDERHACQAQVAGQHEHSERASNVAAAASATNTTSEKRSSRTIDLFRPQATNLPIEKKLEPTSTDFEMSSQSNWIVFSSCAARPTLGKSCLVRDQAACRHSPGDESKGDNGNLYHRVSRDLPSPGQTHGINELRGASSIKSPTTTSEADAAAAAATMAPSADTMQEQEEAAAKSKSTNRFGFSWLSNGGSGGGGGGGDPRPRSTLSGRTLAGSNHHGYRLNDGEECDHIDSNTSSVVRQDQTNDSCTQLAESRTAVLLQEGEKSVEKLLLDIEQRAIRPGDTESSDLIEFIKVIILINKLILALASSSIKTTTTSTTNGLTYTTFCKTTLAN